jgi:hypothetical protein
VLRDRDTDGNGSLDERMWYCQNRRYDVVALIDGSGEQREMVRYSAYGIPFGLPVGDADSDGDCDNGDTADTDQIQAWISASSYDVRGDIDIDGDVDSADEAGMATRALGRGSLSSVESTIGRSGARLSSASVQAQRASVSSLVAGISLGASTSTLSSRASSDAGAQKQFMAKFVQQGKVVLGDCGYIEGFANIELVEMVGRQEVGPITAGQACNGGAAYVITLVVIENNGVPCPCSAEVDERDQWVYYELREIAPGDTSPPGTPDERFGVGPFDPGDQARGAVALRMKVFCSVDQAWRQGLIKDEDHPSNGLPHGERPPNWGQPDSSFNGTIVKRNPPALGFGYRCCPEYECGHSSAEER